MSAHLVGVSAEGGHHIACLLQDLHDLHDANDELVIPCAFLEQGK